MAGRVTVVVDGEDAVRAAAREELRRGAHCIKIMLRAGFYRRRIRSGWTSLQTRKS